jgi:hypothetical protein
VSRCAGPDGWLLHSGDAYFFSVEMDVRVLRCPPGLRFYQWLMEVDGEARLNNQRRLRALIRERGPEIRIFCAHDAAELRAMQTRRPAPSTPAQQAVRGSAGSTPLYPRP